MDSEWIFAFPLGGYPVVVGHGRGQHRAPSIPGLILAATAELAGLTVLHLDTGFEIIAGVTGQPVERPSSSAEPPRPRRVTGNVSH